MFFWSLRGLNQFLQMFVTLLQMAQAILSAVATRALLALAPDIASDAARCGPRLDALLVRRQLASTFALACAPLLLERRRVELFDAVARPLRNALAQYEALEVSKKNIQAIVFAC